MTPPALRRALALVGLALALTRCDAARDERYLGAPVFTVDGQVVLVGEAPSGWADGRHLRAAVAWLEPREPGSGEVVVPEQPASLALSFPTAVELSVFRGPPRTAMLPLQPLSGRIAIGQVAVYDDADGDATWDEEREALFGVGTSALVFAETDVDGPRIHVPKGFSSMLLAGCQGDDGLIGLPVSEVRIPIAATPRIGDDARAAFIDPLCRRVHPVWCAGLADRREACLADPELPACEACADGLYPVDATPDECDLWRAGCAFDVRFDPDDCNAAWRECRCRRSPDGSACTPLGLADP